MLVANPFRHAPMVVVSELCFLTELHTFIELIPNVLGHRLTGCQSQ